MVNLDSSLTKEERQKKFAESKKEKRRKMISTKARVAGGGEYAKTYSCPEKKTMFKTKSGEKRCRRKQHGVRTLAELRATAKEKGISMTFVVNGKRKARNKKELLGFRQVTGYES